MTHNELLAEINFDLADCPHDKYILAIRAVVELHKPINIELCDDPDCCGFAHPDFICNECQSNDYPCPTIQQIIENLK